MAPFGIRLDHCLVGELVVLPDQLIGTVVFIGNGYGSPGYGGYVPVVVVGVFVGGVAAVLAGRQQRRLGAVGSWDIGQVRIVVAAQAQPLLRHTAHAVVGVGQLLPAGKGDRLGTVVLVVGVDGVPGAPCRRASELRQVVFGAIYILL